MNRHDRRKAAKATERYASTDECPCCNIRRVFLQLLDHNTEIVEAVGARIIYPLDDDGQRIIADFGLLTIQHSVEIHEFIVHQFGELAMTLTPDGFTIEKEGPWIAALTGIRMMLDQRFGPVSLGPDNSHTMH